MDDFKFTDYVILNKLEIQQVEFLKEVLQKYNLSVLEPASLENVLKYSISKQLWYKLNARTEKENPPKKSNLKMKSHQAIILLQALNFTGSEALIYRYKDAIIRQFL